MKSLLLTLCGLAAAAPAWAKIPRAPVNFCFGSTCVQAAPPNSRSIRNWVKCDGVTDDNFGVAAAFDAAKNGAFTLYVDCPVMIRIGLDIKRPLFIDSGTTIQFSTAGLFLVDNKLIPAFVIVNAVNVALINWRVEYVGGLPISDATGFYYDSGTYVSDAGSAPASGKFNDITLKQWMISHRGITYVSDNPQWSGPTNASSVFYIKGSSSHIAVSGMKMFVPAGAGGYQFIPMAFTTLLGEKSNQTIDRSSAVVAAFFSVPTDVTFTDIDLDGYYMGWQGSAQNMTITKVRAHRYGDLQDASGGNVGGVGKWMAPPHLFYLNYDITGDPALFNQNIHISDVIDYGNRYGVSRDSNTTSISGNALSLKIGAVNSSVDNYTTYRPDGVLDFLRSENFTLSNVTATYDSLFLKNLWPGIRFPQSGGEKNIVFQNITVSDVATATVHVPLNGNRDAANDQIAFKNVVINLKAYAPNHDVGYDETSAGYLTGNNDMIVDYNVGTTTRTVNGQKGALNWTFSANPPTVARGRSATLSWYVRGAASCSAAGAWSGTLATTGTRTVTPTVGSNSYTLNCVGTDAAAGTSSVLVTGQ